MGASIGINLADVARGGPILASHGGSSRRTKGVDDGPQVLARIGFVRAKFIYLAV
jgi:hypothetical protein